MMPDAPDLDVQVLRTVRAIADTGSITAAAAPLGYSQPAISQQLRRLERAWASRLWNGSGGACG